MNNQNSIQKIIDYSENKLTFKVVNSLRANGWTVLVSPFYHDNYANKPKEIDVIAEKEYEVEKHRWLGTLNIRLFIECKYINSIGVFWFDDQDTTRATQKVSDITRIPMKELKNMNNIQHHYLKPENNDVAKLFSPGLEKGKEDIMYKALTQK